MSRPNTNTTTLARFTRLLKCPIIPPYNGSLHSHSRPRLLRPSTSTSTHARHFTLGSGPGQILGLTLSSSPSLFWHTLTTGTSFAAGGGFVYAGYYAIWKHHSDDEEEEEEEASVGEIDQRSVLEHVATKEEEEEALAGTTTTTTTTLGGGDDDDDVDDGGLEKALRAEEASYRGTGGGVKRYDVVRVRSNEPTEDNFTHKSFASPWRGAEEEEGEEDWTAWGVFDGHLGWQTSQYLKQNLVAALKSHLGPACSDIEPSERSTDASCTIVENAIKTAFLSVDNDIIGPARAAVSDPKMPLVQAAQNAIQAYAGSCAILSLFDPTTRLLYTACVGDCRAVLGRRPDASTPNTTYFAQPLSSDQTGRNAAEISRLESQHPSEPQMIKDGRVLGLAVSRAFGDFQWKLDVATQEALQSRFFRFYLRPGLQTPPYLTAEPVVTTTKIPQGSDDFVILASDGFWDCVSNEQAVELVRRWMWWKRSGSGRQQGGPQEPIVPSKEELKIDRGKPPGYDFQESNTVVKDENCAVHLVRNALGGGDTEQLRAMVRFEAPQARQMRDDITVQVVFFGDVD